LEKEKAHGEPKDSSAAESEDSRPDERGLTRRKSHSRGWGGRRDRFRKKGHFQIKRPFGERIYISLMGRVVRLGGGLIRQILWKGVVLVLEEAMGKEEENFAEGEAEVEL